jgi:hypothetical protein
MSSCGGVHIVSHMTYTINACRYGTLYNVQFIVHLYGATALNLCVHLFDSLLFDQHLFLVARTVNILG